MKKYYVLLLVLALVLVGCVNQETISKDSGVGVQNPNSGSSLPSSNDAGLSDDSVSGTASGNEISLDDNIASEDSAVRIPLSELSETVKYYTYDTGNTIVKYMVVIGSDGEVHTAFDACEVCYRAKKGYSQVGDSVVCNNCGLRFLINDLGTKNKGAGCWPGYLRHEIDGDYVVLDKSDLEAGGYLFS
ncbi:DUF2318 domain-containing protein [Candidatus Micrarchaeota archaeon]|nr:DUF2318 domain-containing protein [Candidatus Micrarchaeota archaeon]MBU1165600.1 DUF2318 domain-containing protein [Candidatus Micrarchaeota archaeon]MBU1886962.1 DUF2318 domain-containing protein [Candidatus Micrarchaeota archaeon]